MSRIWLCILVFYSVSAYLLETVQANVCTCTVFACTPLSNRDNSSPFFIERTSELSNQVHLQAQNTTQCTHLCKTVTQLYAHVWGITPDKSTTKFSD